MRSDHHAGSKRQREKERLKKYNRDRKRVARASSAPIPPSGIDLTPRQFKRCIENLSAILEALPEEGIQALLNALCEGRINGAVFEDKGGCGCLWGTIGRACGWGIAEEGAWAKRFRQRWCAEVDLIGPIAPGDTPQTSPFSRVCYETILEYLHRKEKD